MSNKKKIPVTIGISPKRKVSRLVLFSALSGACVLCVLGALVYTQTPAGKAAATSRALTETAKPSETIRPTNTEKPTSTDRPTRTATSTRLANTPTSLPTTDLPPSPTTAQRSAPIVLPTSSSVCDCSKDYNCSDFNTQRQAQSCFVSCGGNDKINWSGLDNNHDGRACEALP